MRGNLMISASVNGTCLARARFGTLKLTLKPQERVCKMIVLLEMAILGFHDLTFQGVFCHILGSTLC